jgi:hypothetical protein
MEDLLKNSVNIKELKREDLEKNYKNLATQNMYLTMAISSFVSVSENVVRYAKLGGVNINQQIP